MGGLAEVTRYSICYGKADGAPPGYIVWQDDDPAGVAAFSEIPVEGHVHWGVKMTDLRFKVGGTEKAVITCGGGCGLRWH